MGEDRHCETCVYRRSNLCKCDHRILPPECELPGVRAVDLMEGPHSCEHWQPSDQHRIALALETLVEIQAMGAGLIDPPKDDSRPQQIACTCGSYFEVSSRDLAASCPYCKQAYVGDGEGSWNRHPLDDNGPS